MFAGGDGATLLVTRSCLPHNLNYLFDADITASSKRSSAPSEGEAEEPPAKKARSDRSPTPDKNGKITQNVVWEVPSETDQMTFAREGFAVAKYSKIEPLNAALLDSYIEGHQRTTTLFFGRIVSNPDDLPAFEEPLGYNMTYNAMNKGNGNALHRHNSVEIFVALDAPFEIAYGSHGEFKAMLQPWDVVACPAEAIHSYKNMGEDGGQILTFLCGKPAITWAPGVVQDARKRGANCDDSGILLNKDSAAAKVAALQGIDADELILEAGALDKAIYRYAEREKRSLKVSSSAGTMGIHWEDLLPGSAYVPDGDDDTLVVVLSGSVNCQGQAYTHLDVIKQPTFMFAGGDGATLLVTRSCLPHNLSYLFDADITA
jgi:hypothetical protein